MLKPIKTFYVVTRIPTFSDWEEAVNTAKAEDCIVEVRWMPNIYTGWYHEYVFDTSSPEELDQKTPRVYGV